MNETENATIIAFPNEKIVRRPALDHFVEELKEKGKFNFADSFVDELMDSLLESLHSVGVDIENETFIKDFSLSTSILRATIFRNFGLSHPMHEFIDDFVTISNINPETTVDTDEE